MRYSSYDTAFMTGSITDAERCFIIRSCIQINFAAENTLRYRYGKYSVTNRLPFCIRPQVSRGAYLKSPISPCYSLV